MLGRVNRAETPLPCTSCRCLARQSLPMPVTPEEGKNAHLRWEQFLYDLQKETLGLIHSSIRQPRMEAGGPSRSSPPEPSVFLNRFSSPVPSGCDFRRRTSGW